MNKHWTNFRILDKANGTLYSSLIKRENADFSVIRVSKEDDIRALTVEELIPILKDSAERKEAVLAVSSATNNDIDLSQPRITRNMNDRIGRALAAIAEEDSNIELPDVRLIIEYFGKQKVKLQAIDLSPEKLENQRSEINDEFKSLGSNTIAVIKTQDTGITFHPNKSFDSNHSTAAVLKNFDKLFKIEPQLAA